MDWLEKMNCAIDYIENNLDSQVSYQRIAQIAGCSVYQYQRMFSFVIGVPLSEYIRRRRLTLAAFDLQGKNRKVIDVAFKYGYESSESFSRAFQNMHGLTPTSARGMGVRLKAFPRLSFQIILKGVAEMNYRIEKRGAFQVYGLEDVYSYEGISNKQGKTIPQVWQDICANGEFGKMCELLGEDWRLESGFGKEVGEVFAYDSYRYTSDDTFPYLIGCYKPEGCSTDGYSVVNVPASTWAIFSTGVYEQGKLDLRSLKQRIFSEWVQTSKYTVLDGGNFEMYCQNEKSGEYCELWYRVEER